MYETLTLPHLFKHLEAVLAQLPDGRRGTNTQYELSDAGMSAVAVFFTQSASFLAHQRAMNVKTGRSNAERLFGLSAIPSDNPIRNLLDPIRPTELASVYRQVFEGLEQTGVLATYRSFGQQLLMALDGTTYFASQKIHCPQCSQRVLTNGAIPYFHTVLTPVLVQPENPHVLALEPEFIVPQDGHAKQDCEIEAAKRWLEARGAFYAKRGITLLGDDLFSRQPFCRAATAHGFHFILVCKPESHTHLYATVAFLAVQHLLGTKTVRHWNGRYAEISTYRYANHLPLTAEAHAVEVNWCDVTITREDTPERLYTNAFITDFTVTDTTVDAIVRDGQARWKVENANNNVLKPKGYHLEHNFGHGQQFLASVLLSLNLLAFLFHTVCDLVDQRYRALRQVLGTPRPFFHDLETLLRYLPFTDWESLWEFMSHGLDVDTS